MASDLGTGAARTIGSSIGKSTGSVSGLFEKSAKNKKKEAEKTSKPASKKTKEKKPRVLRGTVIEPKPVAEKKPEPEIIDAEIIAERPFRQPYTPKQALPGGKRWEEFKTYVEKTKNLPAVNLDE